MKVADAIILTVRSAEHPLTVGEIHQRTGVARLDIVKAMTYQLHTAGRLRRFSEKRRDSSGKLCYQYAAR
jgi:hypothetical protein